MGTTVHFLTFLPIPVIGACLVVMVEMDEDEDEEGGEHSEGRFGFVGSASEEVRKPKK